MAQAIEGLASEVEQLSARVRKLELRLAALEGHTEPAPAPPPPTFIVRETLPTKPPETWRGFPPAQLPSGGVAAFGKAVLGIAGAYLLRAISESGAIPQLAILMVAILYACGWMLWAARTHADSPFASNVYGVTSAMILAPLMWEATVRFQVISATFGAVVLAGFLSLTLVLCWRRNLQALPWIATLATVATAWALIIATHEVVPLTAALLTMWLAVEVAACFAHRFSTRAISAISVDLAIALTIAVMTSAEGVPVGYRPAGPLTLILLCMALLVISSVSIAIRGFAMRQKISVLEIMQTGAGFALATFGVLRATHGSGAPSLGILYLLLAGGCYWGTLWRFAPADYARNRRVSATWAAALLLAGSWCALPSNLCVVFLCAAAITAAFRYTYSNQLSLGLHASLYVAAATALSSMPVYAAKALTGSVPASPDWTLWVVTITAVSCYAVGSRVREEQAKRRLLWAVPAFLGGLSFAALVVVAIVWVGTGHAEWGAARLSVVRTVVTCTVALGFGYSGSRWNRPELGWVAYTVVACGAVKLLLEDLRFGNAASLVVSFLFYGAILIVLPKLMRTAPATT
jgi:hypothetical protein